MSGLTPVATGLWTEDGEPRLIAGRAADGQLHFPMPDGDAATGLAATPLSRTGTLWSWTVQRFEPKRPPYAGPSPFAPFMVGYVELPGEIIVEARLEDVTEPRIGMALELRIIPFADDRATFAFGPTA